MESSYQEAPSWVRRGHTRKPNMIVIGLYWIFDKIQDFVPMFSVFFKFLGRSSLIIVNLIILAGTIIMSAAHSLELLRYAGAKNGLEWVGVVIWELLFIFSSILLANDFKKGNGRSGWGPWLGFGLGFAFVEISNIMGMAGNWIGIGIGISTPILLLVSKGLLAHQFKSNSQTVKQSNKQSNSELSQTVKQSDRIEQSNSQTDTNIIQTLIKNHTANQTVSNVRTVEQSNNRTDSQTLSDTQTLRQSNSQTPSNKQIQTLDQTVSNSKNTISKQDFKNQTLKNQTGNRTDSNNQTPNNQTVKQANRRAKSNTKRRTGKQASNTQTSNVLQFVRTDDPEKIALDYYNQTGTHLSIRQLASKCNITNYRAQKILNELKQKIS